MITLIYASSATRKMTQDDLLDILNIAKSNNEALNVTGILLYRGGNFLQLLEGEPEAVEGLYAKIKEDPRHDTVMTIMHRKIKERQFDNWEMGFVNLDDYSAEDLPEGYSDFLVKPVTEEFASKPMYVKAFLMNFKNLMI